MVVVVKAPWMSRVYDYESWFHMQGAAFLNTHTDTPISLCTLCVCVCVVHSYVVMCLLSVSCLLN